MKVGVYSNQFGHMPFESFLKRTAELGAEMVELGVGGMYATGKHCVPSELLADKIRLDDFKALLNKYHMQISAFGMHGNFVHPNPELAGRDIEDFKRACALAEKLGVDRFNVMSGLPAAGPKDEYPNWICNPWPDELQEGLRYQWEEKLIPFWTWATGYAADYGVKYLDIEAHPGMAVYNVATLKKLSSAVGSGIRCSFDPSHLSWMGSVDIYEVVVSLGDLIKHVHGKEVYINRPYARVNGMLTSNPFNDYLNRPWTFRSPGYGSDPWLWKDIAIGLAAIGYDYVISVEHEDWHMSSEDALSRSITTLKTIVNERTGPLFGSPRP